MSQVKPGSKCVQCGKPIPRYEKDYVYRKDEDVLVRAGEFRGSNILAALDCQHHFFCTLTCAARYGVRAATERSRL